MTDSDGELQEVRNGGNVSISKIENEMNKLRSDSASPSTFSTASSGSPLVRGSSNGSSGFSNIIVANGNKRPAPTSIAAAQLQQQQQLEFTNRLSIDQQQKACMTSKKNSSKHVSSSKHSNRATKAVKSLEQRQQQTRVSNSWSPQQTNNNNTSSPPPNYDGSKKVKNCDKIEKNKSDYDGKESFGYNVAKSLAFRAYRFNEFWSINKMKYMNLACLLMTLVCLVTILLFSSSNSSTTTTISNNNNPITTNSRVIPRKSPLVDEMLGFNSPENIDSLDIQPLVASATSQQQQTASANSNDNLFENLNLLDNRKDGAKFRRKSEPSNSDEISSAFSGVKLSTSEREIEDSSNNNNLELHEKDSSDRQTSGSGKSELEPNSLIDPIISQIFNDSEIGSMLKQAFKKASNSTNGNGGFNKPIIRKSKNGATIIISSSSTFNNSNSLFNDSSSSPFPSLIEKLLPPMFRPLNFGGSDSSSFSLKDKFGLDGNSSSNNPNQAGLASSIATITINSEPIFASSSSPFGISRLTSSNPFASILSSAVDPFSRLSHHHNHPHHHHASRLPGLFMEPLAFRAPTPFGPPSLFGSPFAGPMSSPPGLMSMIIRANQLEQADEDSTQSPQSSSKRTTTNGKGIGEWNAKDNDAPKAQTSQQQNSTTGKQSTDKHSAANNNNNDSEVETLDMSEFIPVRSSPNPSAFSSRLHNFYPPRSMISKPSGSVVIFSSGNLGTSPSRNVVDPFRFPFTSSAMSSPFSPFISPPISQAPQMMFIGGGDQIGPHGGSNGAQMLNPFIKSLFNSVMSDIVPVPSSTTDVDQTKDSNNKTESNDRNTSSNSSNKATARSSSSSSSSSSSNLNPSWTALSSADLDDDWTNGGAPGEGSIDRWDEQQNPSPLASSNKHIQPRLYHHRSDEERDSNSPTESSEVVSGIQFEQHIPPLDRHQMSEFISGNFRSPRFHKVLALPLGESQVLTRTNFEEPSESTATLSRPFQPTSPFFSPRSISSSSNDDPAPHVGFITRLLSDISRRSEGPSTNKQTGINSNVIKDRSMEDDFDEFDPSSMNENMLMQPSKHISAGNNWSKVRSHARIRMRPISELKSAQISGSLVAPSNSDTIFMPPNHLTIADNSENDKESQATSMESNKPSFDDTMNSMEDRLNHVLSLASHQTFLPNHKQTSANEEQQSEASNKLQSVPMSRAPTPSSYSSPSQPPQSLAQNNARAAVAHSIPLPPLVLPRSEPKQQHQIVEQKPTQQQQQQQKANSNNPFTSPSSPLFGFPASTLAQNDLPKVSKSSQELNNNNNNNGQQNLSNRQQRSFTYHSNNEVASSLAGHSISPRTVDQINSAESIDRSRFNSLSGPPASAVMGRRLDDGPFSDEQVLLGAPQPEINLLGNHQRQQKSAVPSLEEQNNASNSVADKRHLQQTIANLAEVNSIAAQNENYRTIVV